MLPLHAAHPRAESAIVFATGLVVVAAAVALTREGWSRVGALGGVGVVAGGLRAGIEAVGPATHLLVHLAGHALEIGAVLAVAFAGYYALIEVRAVAPAGA